jgi:transcriptional regulator with XRE-family HTH domain
MDKICTNTEVGRRIKELRVKKRLNQSELGKIVFVSKSLISKWESSVSVPRLDMIYLLANALDVPVNFLLGDGDVTKQNIEYKTDLIIVSYKQRVYSWNLIVLSCC